MLGVASTLGLASRAHALQGQIIDITKIATQPQAAVGITGYGGNTWDASIHAIAFDGDSLIAGYGDWNFNSDSAGGPDAHTGIQLLDLTTKQWGSLTRTGTESNSIFRTINGHLYAPTTDPSTGGGGWATNASGTWTTHFPSELQNAVHIFDIASLTNSDQDLWLFGATNNPPSGSDDTAGLATIWHSIDGGQTWQTVQTDGSTPVNATGGFERYYWGAALNGKIYAQAADTSPQAPMRVYNSSTQTWSTLSYQTSCTTMLRQVVTFDGQIICDGTDNGFYTFDGSLHAQIFIQDNSVQVYPQAMAVDSGNLYVLASNGHLLRTAAFSQPWQDLGVVQMPSSTHISSIGVHGGSLYLGDSEAGIWQSDVVLSASLSSTVNDCLASTGDDASPLTLIAVGLLLAGLSVIFFRCKGRRGKGLTVIVGLSAVGILSCIAVPDATYAASANCTSGGNYSTTDGVANSTAGASIQMMGQMQVYSVINNAAPSAGASFVASSLQLALVNNPVPGSTVSIDGVTITVPGEGVYSVDPTNGSIVFTPESEFVGTASGVRFTIKDTNGQSTTNTYVPSAYENVLVQVSFNLTNTGGVYGLVTDTQQVAANATDFNTGALLSISQRAVMAAHSTFDMTGQTLQTVADYTATKGLKLVYDPSTDVLTMVLTDQAIFNSFAAYSCGDVAPFTMTPSPTFGDNFTGYVRLNGTGGNCGAV